MKFVDESIIQVTAGNGGRGCLSFRRERSCPKGGPNGGDGGDGGDIHLEADSSHHTLIDLKSQRLYYAPHGKPGEGQRKTGASGLNMTIKVPLGTVVFDTGTNECLGDLTTPGERLLVAIGGRHGLGNVHFKSSVNQAPRKITRGSPGESRELRLELRLLADVGLLGQPNAGKSSLLRAVSRAEPAVGNYPFTTLHPNLGVVRTCDDEQFVLADIPGLIAGAAHGRGLGNQFLKQLTRTRLLLHVVDVTPEDMSLVLVKIKDIEHELLSSPFTFTQPRWLVLNKIDLLNETALDTLLKELYAHRAGAIIFPVSAKNGTGCPSLMRAVQQWLGSGAQQGVALGRKTK